MHLTSFISCHQHTLPSWRGVTNVSKCFPSLFYTSGRSKPGPLPPPFHCYRSRLIAFIVLTGFRNRKLINGASLSPVYFMSACFLPSHLSVCSHFICHNSAHYLFFCMSISTLLFRLSFVRRSPDCLFAATKSFLCPLNVLYLFLRVFISLVIIGNAFLGTFPIFTVSFSRDTARVNTFSSSLSRVIDQRSELRATSAEICRLGERNYDVHGDNPFSPQLLTGNF